MDMTTLLAPLAPPQGEDLRLTPVFDDLKELRREDDHNVSYGIWTYELKVAHWDRLEQKTYNLLTTQTKDLEVLLWYIECLVQRDKIQGLVDGINLLHQFSTTFWNVFFPTDPEHRGALLEAFDRRLTQHILQINLCGHPDYNVTLMHWKNAQHMHHLLTRNAGLEDQLLAEYGMNLETVRNRFGLSTEKFVIAAKENFTAIEQTLKTFIALCDKKIPQAEVSFSETLKTLKDVEYVLTKEVHYYKPPPVVMEKLDEPLVADEPVESSEKSTSSSGMPIKNREDVYVALQELSHYLVKTEPHSPVPAILDMLIRWKDLPLQDIISQIQNSPAQYQLLHTIIGK
jgi:type VI secretion system protein ImpA